MDKTKHEHTRALNLAVPMIFRPRILNRLISHSVGKRIDLNPVLAQTREHPVSVVSRAGSDTRCDSLPAYERQRIDP